MIDRASSMPGSKLQVRSLWAWLIRPHPSVSDVAEQRRVRLFSSLMLLIMVIVLVDATIRTFTVAGNWLFEVGVTVGVIHLPAFLVNRSRYYKLAHYGYILLINLMMLAMSQYNFTLTGQFSTNEYMMIAWLLVFAALVEGKAFYATLAVNVLVVFIYLLRFPLDPDYIGPFVVCWIALLLYTDVRDRIERDRQAELRKLNTDLTATNEALRASESRLEQRVVERTRELAAARDEADRANQVKSQFLASMSHELRTPLNAILNFTEMMTLGMVGPVTDQQKDILGKSLDSGKHLLDLINDVLDISKMESGMLKLFVEENVNLYDEIRTVVAAGETLVKGKSTQFIQDIDPHLPCVSGDRRRIRQILLNLLSNASKFTEQGSITLSVKNRGDEILFAVIDSGPGISKEDQAGIFNPFVQTEAGIAHGGGTGLGLPISRHLAEAHGGKLWVESEPGEGSAFFVTLPLYPHGKGEPQ